MDEGQPEVKTRPPKIRSEWLIAATAMTVSILSLAVYIYQAKIMQEQQIDLVFLDIWMSGVNGGTVCQALKTDPEKRAVPIIMFSANRDTEQIATQCGADGFLSKPFEVKTLIEIVKKYLPG